MTEKAKDKTRASTEQEERKTEQARAMRNLLEVKQREQQLQRQGRLRLVQVDKNTTLLLRDDQDPKDWQRARTLDPEVYKRERYQRAQKTMARDREHKRKLRTPEYVIQKEIARLRREVQEVIQKTNYRKEGYTTAQRNTLHNAVRFLRDDHGWTYPELATALGISKARAVVYYKTDFVDLANYREARGQ